MQTYIIEGTRVQSATRYPRYLRAFSFSSRHITASSRMKAGHAPPHPQINATVPVTCRPQTTVKTLILRHFPTLSPSHFRSPYLTASSLRPRRKFPCCHHPPQFSYSSCNLAYSPQTTSSPVLPCLPLSQRPECSIIALVYTR